MMHTQIRYRSLASIALGAFLLAMAPTASAYLTAEDVLIGTPPPNSRTTAANVKRQAAAAAERRDAEFDEAYAAQHGTEETDLALEEDEEVHAAAPTQDTLSADDRAIIESLRALARIRNDQAQQPVVYYIDSEGMHAGAPLAGGKGTGKGTGDVLPGKGTGLVPSGAGGILTMITMIGALGYTLRRTGRLNLAVAKQK